MDRPRPDLTIALEPGQTVRIGTGVKVTVVAHEDGKTRLSIDVPSWMPVVREQRDGARRRPAA